MLLCARSVQGYKSLRTKKRENAEKKGRTTISIKRTTIQYIITGDKLALLSHSHCLIAAAVAS